MAKMYQVFIHPNQVLDERQVCILIGHKLKFEIESLGSPRGGLKHSKLLSIPGFSCRHCVVLIRFHLFLYIVLWICIENENNMRLTMYLDHSDLHFLAPDSGTPKFARERPIHHQQDDSPNASPRVWAFICSHVTMISSDEY